MNIKKKNLTDAL